MINLSLINLSSFFEKDSVQILRLKIVLNFKITGLPEFLITQIELPPIVFKTPEWEHHVADQDPECQHS